MADKAATNKLPNAQKSFGKQFQFTEMSTSLRVGFKTTINICVTIQLAFV